MRDRASELLDFLPMIRCVVGAQELVFFDHGRHPDSSSRYGCFYPDHSGQKAHAYSIGEGYMWRECHRYFDASAFADCVLEIKENSTGAYILRLGQEFIRLGSGHADQGWKSHIKTPHCASFLHGFERGGFSF
jgi:hypothetical protein